MHFAGVNYGAIGAAAVAAWLFGALWYGLLFRTHWVAAQGKTAAEERASSGSYVPYIVAFLALFVMAWVLAGVIGHTFTADRINPRTGALSGAIVWAGFIATVLTTSYAFHKRSLALLAIDAFHYLGVLVIEGAVIGLMGI